ncbi:MAG: metal ABC transporter substrate-binding protein [Spirochaeta sp.]|jgi:ABC-type Zn uptake system ZnuABC Zn-binding protein ZnuA|nr:metal ABC transporter substrate-binding protein [Spirochaeta sp.]
MSAFRSNSASSWRSLVTISVLLLLLPGFALFAGGQSETDHADDAIPRIEPVDLPGGRPLKVVVTTNMIGDVLSNIAGDAIDLTVLVPMGQNPHSYEPAPQALVAIESADLVFVNGFDLEENLLSIVENTARAPIVPVSVGVTPPDPTDDHEDDGHGAADPHVWFAPTSALVWTDNIEQVLSAADPDRADTYRRGAAHYRAQLEALDAEIRRQVEAIPADKRTLVVDHAAMGYFADAYGFHVLGSVIPATTDQAEPSAQAISRLVELIHEEEVPAIFIGGTASQGLRDLVDAVATEVGRDVEIRELLTGSLAPAGEPGDTYVTFIEYNTRQIMEGLGY